MYIKEFVILSKEAKKERINLLNTIGKRVLNQSENSKLEFLNMLFEYEQKHLTKADFKKKINTLYGIHKRSKSGEISYRDSDTIANSNILRLDGKSLYGCFSLAYDYINNKIYNDCVKAENWVSSIN